MLSMHNEVFCANGEIVRITLELFLRSITHDSFLVIWFIIFTCYPDLHTLLARYEVENYCIFSVILDLFNLDILFY